jgi:flagellin
MLSAIENATNDVTDMLQRMRELAVQAVNDTNTQKDRGYLQGEVSALIAEIDRVATQTQYNGQAILDGSMSGKIQVGTEAGQTVSFSVSDIQSLALGLKESSGTGLSVNSEWSDSGKPNERFVTAAQNGQVIEVGDKVSFSDHPEIYYEVLRTGTRDNGDMEFSFDQGEDGRTDFWTIDGTSINLQKSSIDLVNDPSSALSKITSAIEQVAGDRAEYGALQNRLEYTVSNLMNVSEFTTAARSRIADADFAAESARLAKAQVLQQSGTAMLAQANASSQLALSLIR